MLGLKACATVLGLYNNTLNCGLIPLSVTRDGSSLFQVTKGAQGSSRGQEVPGTGSGQALALPHRRKKVAAALDFVASSALKTHKALLFGLDTHPGQI